MISVVEHIQHEEVARSPYRRAAGMALAKRPEIEKTDTIIHPITSFECKELLRLLAEENKNEELE